MYRSPSGRVDVNDNGDLARRNEKKRVGMMVNSDDHRSSREPKRFRVEEQFTPNSARSSSTFDFPASVHSVPTFSSTPPIYRDVRSYMVDFNSALIMLKMLQGNVASRREGTSLIKVPDDTLDWTGWISLDLDHDNFVGAGGFGEVFMGLWDEKLHDYGPIPRVVVKRCHLLKLRNDQAQKRYKQIRREVTIWHSLNHEHIVPFVGICYLEGGIPGLVSLWMENGDIKSYLGRNHQADVNVLMLEVALGLKFLHDRDIVHGDIKGANILVNKDGLACLCDFGISRAIESDHSSLWETTTKAGADGTLRWQAPELLKGEQTEVTKQSDVYGWAVTYWEVITKNIPFYQLKQDPAVIIKVGFEGLILERPLDPETIPDDLWELWKSCWDRDLHTRLPIDKVFWKLLLVIIGNYKSEGRSILSFLAEQGVECIREIFAASGWCTSDAVSDACGGLDVLVLCSDLLDRNQCDIDSTCDLGRTALSYAVEGRNEDVVKMLLDRGANVNGGKRPPLCAAADVDEHKWSKFRLTFVPLLLDRGAAINVRDEDGMTPLMIAAAAGNGKIVEMLLDRGAAINERNNEGHTALILSFDAVGDFGFPFMGIVELLLQHGASFHSNDRFFDIALSFAALYGRLELVQSLINFGCPINTVAVGRWGKTPLMLAMEHEELDHDKVHLLLEHGATFDAEDEAVKQFFALSPYASRPLELVKRLLENGVDVNAEDPGGSTALSKAVREAEMEVVDMLLDYGADVNHQDSRGNTALVYATRDSQLDRPVLVLLLRRGARTDIHPWLNDAILMFLAVTQEYDLLHMVMEREGCSIQLHTAVPGTGALDNVRLLLDGCTDKPSCLVRANFTLTYAVQENRHDIAQLALRFGAEVDFDIESFIGNYKPRWVPFATPLTFAIKYERYEIVKMLIDAGAEIENLFSETFWRAVKITAENAHWDIMQSLLNAWSIDGFGYHKNFRNEALAYSVMAQQPDIVRSLLNHNANPNALHNGERILDIADRSGCDDICSLLQQRIINAGNKD